MNKPRWRVLSVDSLKHVDGNFDLQQTFEKPRVRSHKWGSHLLTFDDLDDAVGVDPDRLAFTEIENHLVISRRADASRFGDGGLCAVVQTHGKRSERRPFPGLRWPKHAAIRSFRLESAIDGMPHTRRRACPHIPIESPVRSSRDTQSGSRRRATEKTFEFTA